MNNVINWLYTLQRVNVFRKVVQVGNTVKLTLGVITRQTQLRNVQIYKTDLASTKHTHSTERPARPTLALILDLSDVALLSPVDFFWQAKFNERWHVDHAVVRSWLISRSHFITVHSTDELMVFLNKNSSVLFDSKPSIYVVLSKAKIK